MSNDDQPNTGQVVASYTKARRRPSEIGRLQGWSMPIVLTYTQVGVGAIGVLVAVGLVKLGVPWLLAVVPVGIATLVCGRMVRRVRIDDRTFLWGVAGLIRSRIARRRLHPMSRKRTADVICGNVMVGSDHSMWAVFSVEPESFGRLSSPQAQLVSAATVEQLVRSLSERRWRLASVMTHTTPAEIEARMAAASTADTWRIEIDAELKRLSRVELTERTFWLMVDIGDARPPRGRAGWLARLRTMTGVPGMARASWIDDVEAQSAISGVIAGSPRSLDLQPATANEIVGILCRIPGADSGPPPAEQDWAHLHHSDAAAGAIEVGPGVVEGASAWNLAQADWTEPARGIAVARTDDGAVAHLSAVVSTLPDRWLCPGGNELLHRLEALGDGWEWVLDATVTLPAVATAKTRNMARDLNNQVREYDNEPSGPPPELAVAAQQIDHERNVLAARGNAAEYSVTVVMSTQLRLAGDELSDSEQRVLRDRHQRLRSMAAAIQVRVVAPAGDQVTARRLWAPHRCLGSRLIADYRQFLLSDAVAGLGPLLQSRLGDPQGAVLGALDDRGTWEPVLFDPTLGPRALDVDAAGPRSPAMAVVGRLGSGKSAFMKRILWTVLAQGGQVIALDRSRIGARHIGEYVLFAEAVQEVAPELDIEIVDVTDPDGLSIDPMRVGLAAEHAAQAAVKLISVVADLDPHSAIPARLQKVASRMAGTPLREVVTAAAAQASQDSRPESWAAQASEWDRIMGLLDALAEDPIGGSLFDANRPAVNLGADLVVLWAPGLSLAERPDSPSDLAAAGVVLGMMLTARGLIFANPERYAAALFDEFWAMLKDERTLSVIVEAARDGRKHNAGMLVASQTADDLLKLPALAQLLGYVAVFPVEPEAVPGACRLAGVDRDVAGDLLRGLSTGMMLWRDVFGRTGVVEGFLPAEPRLRAAVNTNPGKPADDGGPAEEDPYDTDAEFGGSAPHGTSDGTNGTAGTGGRLEAAAGMSW